MTTEATARTLIELRNLTKTYHLGDVDVPVLRGISMKIHEGTLLALMGPSGGGKSTLMNILGFLDTPSGGQYLLDGRDVTTLSSNARADLRNERIGFVFQNFNLLARTSALKNVMMPLEYSRTRQRPKEMREWAEHLLERVGLKERMDHQPSQMSGGQQQRVAIARALVNRPKILFADEPTGNLDSKTSEEVLQMFQELNAKEGLTIVLVTHSPEVGAFAKEAYHIKDGLMVDGTY
ncbi:MAG: ABC transporter ATP-binding protein [Kiritimatiellae bacterium]|nr:ABC transporter ATP-binding protein [Kiritimatiellia bacterium]MBR4946383.1 ABC transporter ATP-binding protein [Kiritimatiellia bacterium]MBR5587549.1 ABC transporter ATP-binding protein [Kiritimatiellia bacterium]